MEVFFRYLPGDGHVTQAHYQPLQLSYLWIPVCFRTDEFLVSSALSCFSVTFRQAKGFPIQTRQKSILKFKVCRRIEDFDRCLLGFYKTEIPNRK
jgi:hypothetical protein